MELAAAGTPFVYVPLRGHFERNRQSGTGCNAAGRVAA
jgi:hypothetical protein